MQPNLHGNLAKLKSYEQLPVCTLKEQAALLQFCDEFVILFSWKSLFLIGPDRL